MRGAIRTLAAGLWLGLWLWPCLFAPAPPARAEAARDARGETARARARAPGAGPIARARELIAAGKRAAALPILEDALLDLSAPERRAAVEMLRESYRLLAREAEAAGKRREADSYRDNLAILDRVAQAPSGPAPAPNSDPNAPSRSQSVQAGAASRPPRADAERADTDRPRSEPPALEEPAALPGPEGMPPPPRPALAPTIPLAGPLVEKRNAEGDGALVASINPASGTPEAARERPAAATLPPEPQPTTPVAGAMSAAPSVEPNTMALTGEPMPAAPSIEPRPAAPIAAGPAPIRTPGAVPARPALANALPSRTPGPERAGRSNATELDRANQWFRARRYGDAGRVYAKLAAANRLPADRRPHWAYCRAYEVVRRINAHPRSRREWDAIDAEIQGIQRLTPGNWFGEYLHNHVAEARRLRRWPADRSGKTVVRGAAPDGPPPAPSSPFSAPGASSAPRSAPRLSAPRADDGPVFGPATPGPNPALELPSLAPTPIVRPDLEDDGPPSREGSPSAAGRPAAGGRDRTFAAAPAPAAGTGTDADADADAGAETGARPGTTGGPAPAGPVDWQIHESTNFRIFHCDPELARRAAEVAESVRAGQARRWGSPAAHVRWSPRCDVYLYPGPEIYARETGQPEMSPGISTMANDHVRVTSRRMNLRADNPLLLAATLPHEVAHIVLADLFIARVIPRWADEGIAVLAEPPEQQRYRVADLRAPLASGRVFHVARLMTMDYPDAQDSRLFYAESVSLTRYLMELGTPDRFIRFLHDSQRVGADAALKDVYQIEGTSDLHNRWLAHAQKENEAALASNRDEADVEARTARK